MVRGGLFVGGEAARDAGFVVGGEEAGFGGEVVHHPEGGDGDDDGGQAFDDEDPGPAVEAAEAGHFGDCGGEEPAEGAGDGGRGEEDGGADAEFSASVPAGEVVVYAGKETGFGETEEETGGHEAVVVFAEAHEGHAETPEDHDDGEVDVGAHAFEEDVREGLEDGVGDEEDGQAHVVLRAVEVEVVCETFDFCIALEECQNWIGGGGRRRCVPHWLDQGRR